LIRAVFPWARSSARAASIHIASLGWEHIVSRGYVWPSEPLKQKVSALRKLRSAFLDAA
jgi:hypothetical protein